MPDDSRTATRQTDLLDPARARALLTALARDAALGVGDPLPPFFQYLYFWDAQPPGNLGRDGHPKVGGLIPDMGLPRRMWAGGALDFHAPLRAGIPCEKVTRLASFTRKEGRTGPLGFVTLEHEFVQDGFLCVSERQDLVYRPDPDPSAARPVPPQVDKAAEQTRAAHFDTTLLFRYSALTFNGHRIHYDRAYAQEVEGYDGLVVHGPLLAQLLMLWLEETAPLRHFSFKATAPLMHFEQASLCRSGDSLWVEGPDGRQCMTAECRLDT